MVLYPYLIQLYGAPNGLCSSITKSKHIKAVKEPYRCSNCFVALGQMLLTNQRLDKLSAVRANFTSRHMLRGSCIRPSDTYDDDIWAGLGLDDDALLDDHPALVIDRSDEDDCGPVDDEVIGKVTLAKRKGRLARHCP